MGYTHSQEIPHEGCNPGPAHPMRMYCETEIALLLAAERQKALEDAAYFAHGWLTSAAMNEHPPTQEMADDVFKSICEDEMGPRS